MPYIYSTASTDIDFHVRDEAGRVLHTIHIAGKANIPNKHMLTSQGVSTSITESELKQLEAMPLYEQMRKAGFLVADIAKKDADKAAKSMAPKDKSAPRQKEDFKQSALGEQVEVTTQAK